MSPLDLVLIGNLLVDDLVFEDGTTRMAQPGGALLHAALAAAAWGTRAGCVTIAGSDYPRAALDDLRGRGVALDGLTTVRTPGARVWLLYEDGGRRMLHRAGRPSHAEVSPEPTAVPASWLRAPAVHVAPMPLPRQRALTDALGDGTRLVSVDPCEPITDGSLDAWRAVLARVDVVFASREELRLSGADEHPEAALRALAVGRVRYVLHKRGAAGGVLFDAREGTLTPWSARPAREVDPTGAGDAFAGAFMGALAVGCRVDEALARGAATASVAVEAEGSLALLYVTRAELEARATGGPIRTD